MFKDIIEEIKKAKTICLLTHENPDGDAFGSITAMYGYIKENFEDKVVDMYTKTPTEKYAYLEYTKQIKIGEVPDIIYDLAISLDTAEINMLHIYKELYLKAKVRMQIDHHITNTGYADGYVKDASSACEVVYLGMRSENMKTNKNILEGIYTGLSTDTGSFKHSNTTADTFEVAREIVQNNIDVGRIANLIYNQDSLGRLKAIAYTIDNIELHNDGKIAFVFIPMNIMSELNITNEDIAGLIDYLRSINTVEVAVLAKEKADGDVKISMRSKYYINVSEICSKYNGGGHAMAAGCTFSKDIDYKNILIKDIAKELV